MVLVLRALGLGDLLTAVPALRGIADRFRGHRRVLAAPVALEGIALLTGAVDEVVDTGPLEPLPEDVNGADAAFNLHGKGPQSHRIVLASRPVEMVAFAHPAIPESSGGPPWRDGEHEVARWCRLLAHRGVACDPTALDVAAPELPIGAALRGATVIHPGAASAARRWPLERWVEVARYETRAGRRVVITGAEKEARLGSSLAEQAGLDAGSVYSGRTDLMELASIVGVAERVLCGDTGVAHLATAVGTPSIVLFGPTSPATWGPPPERAQHRVLWKGRAGDPHAASPDQGLLAIEVAEVIAELEHLALV